MLWNLITLLNIVQYFKEILFNDLKQTNIFLNTLQELYVNF